MLKRFYIVFILLLTGISFLHADENLLNGLRCGQIVTLTATPDAGYRFIGWSDGNMDNPRRVEVTEAMQIEAMFELACDAQYNIPVLFLYGHLYMVNNTALKQLGYTIDINKVQWYRIVGDIDEPNSTTKDDILVGTGLYLNRDGMADGTYYVQYNLPSATDVDCADMLRSQPFRISMTALSDEEGGKLKIVPSVAEKGQTILLEGLPLTDPAKISVYNTAGQLVETLYSSGTESVAMPTHNAAGCYLVRITNRTIDRTLIYIIH